MHRVYTDLPMELPEAGQEQILTVIGDEAEHALRVKRLQPGEAVELLDGAGQIGAGVVLPNPNEGKKRRGPAELLIRLDRLEDAPVVRPILEVWSATPKGSRVDDMIDQLSQIGAASWTPMVTARTIVDPREHKLARLERVAREASKQCGRAWLLTINPVRSFQEALQPEAGTALIIAHATGTSYRAHPEAARVRLLIGPEGDFTPEELEQAQQAGASMCIFGPHVMRVATAAVAASSVIMNVR